MGVMCQACGAENHGGVSVCRLCAAALEVRKAPAGDQRRRPAGPVMSAGRWSVVLGLLLLLGLLWAWSQSRAPADRAAPVGAPAAAGAHALAPSRLPADPAGDSLAQATAAAEARLKASLERLAREDHERTEAHARQRVTQERARQQTEQSRRREQVPASVQPDLARLPPTPAPVTAAAPVASAAAQVAPQDRPATPEAPATMQSVEQRCAGSTNFFSRSICQSQACADPALAQTPACRRLREVEQANRPDPNLIN